MASQSTAQDRPLPSIEKFVDYVLETVLEICGNDAELIKKTSDDICQRMRVAITLRSPMPTEPAGRPSQDDNPYRRFMFDPSPDETPAPRGTPAPREPPPPREPPSTPSTGARRRTGGPQLASSPVVKDSPGSASPAVNRNTTIHHDTGQVSFMRSIGATAVPSPAHRGHTKNPSGSSLSSVSHPASQESPTRGRETRRGHGRRVKRHSAIDDVEES